MDDQPKPARNLLPGDERKTKQLVPGRLRFLQLNVLSTGLMEELTAELERQASRPEVRAIVIKGAGRAFSAGHDLKEMLDKTLDEERELFALCNKLMAKVQSVPVPVIAAPHGI